MINIAPRLDVSIFSPVAHSSDCEICGGELTPAPNVKPSRDPFQFPDRLWVCLGCGWEEWA